MMAGVGIILAKVGIEMFKEEKLTGATSLVTAILTYFLDEGI
ncbi:MAG: hypothetical protein WCZ27_02635 [Tissierellaceae bacterium]